MPEHGPVWNPEEYAVSSNAQLRWARELMSRIQFRGDEAVLDVGCGDGKISAEFAGNLHAGHVVGIDLSPEMIEYAHKAYPPLRFPNLEFRCMDASHIEFENRFDLVFSNAALHWVPDQRSAILGAARALRHGGRLITSCGGGSCATDMLETAQAMTTESRWKRYFNDFKIPYYFLGPEEYAPWLAEAGLTVACLELVSKDMTHAGREGLAAWLRTTWHPYLNAVPEAERTAFLEAWLDHYLAHVPLDAAGRAHVGMVRLEVDATRE